MKLQATLPVYKDLLSAWTPSLSRQLHTVGQLYNMAIGRARNDTDEVMQAMEKSK